MLLACPVWSAEPTAPAIAGNEPIVALQQPDPPLAATEALSSFALPDGFRIELVAAEPLVLDPVALAFAADGSLFVVEMRDYPTGPPAPPGRIRRLEDTDGDGRMDRASVFADHLAFPTGIHPWRGGLLVAAAPEIVYLADTDGDGISDVRRTLFRGFVENNPQHRVNGLRFGIDGWIHGANAQGEIRAEAASDPRTVTVTGSDFRIDPDRGIFEPMSGRSQYALAIDAWGNHFVNNNSHHIRHAPLPQHYLQRNPFLAVGTNLEDISDHGSLAKVYPTSRVLPRFNEFHHAGYTTTACGLEICLGGRWPAPYEGSSLVCEPLHNLIHRDELVAAGPSFVARRGEVDREFLTSSDAWFRPVFLCVGPDGGIYVADFYRWIIEHPFGIPVEMQQGIDFRAGDDRGRIYRIVHESTTPIARPALSTAPVEQLVQQLNNPNVWWRLTAERLLLERRDSAASAPLLRLANDTASSDLARLHAAWTLQALDTLDESTVLGLLVASNPWLRRHGLKLAEPLLPTAHGAPLVEPVLRCATDDDAGVRYQAALSLGYLMENPAHRSAAMDALVNIAHLGAADERIRLAVLSSLANRELDFLSAWCETSDVENHLPGALEMVASLVDIIARRSRDEELPRLIDTIAGRHSARPNQWQLTAWSAAVARLNRSGVALEPLIERANVAATLSMWAKWAEESLADEPATQGMESEEVARIVSILAGKGGPAAQAILLQLVDPTRPQSVQRAAVRALIGQRSPTIMRQLLERWKRLSVTVRAELLAGGASYAPHVAMLADAIDAAQVHPGEIGAADRQQLMQVADPAIRARLSAVWDRWGDEERAGRIKELLPRVMALAGDVDRGRQLFVANCGNCHNRRTPTEGILFEGHGRTIGPDLGSVRSRSKETLLVDMLDPSRSLDPRYLSFTLVTQSGRSLAGMIVEESATGVTLQAAGPGETVLRGEIAEMQSTGLSVMPTGFDQNLGEQQLADLLAFLQSE